MPVAKEKHDQGVNTATDPEDLQSGEMQQAVGMFYKPGNRTELHKQNGRSEFGDTSSAAKIKGVELLQYDSGGTDRLVALSGTTLYSAPSPGKTGVFSSLKAGLGSAATSLSAAHYNDVHYLSTGEDALFAVESDGTIYDAGMQAPREALTRVISGGVNIRVRANADDSDFDNGANAYDGDGTTFAGGTLSTIATLDSVFSFTGTANTASDRTLSVDWELAGLANPDEGPFDNRFDDAGGEVDAGWVVTVKLEYSEDNGSTWSTFLNLPNLGSAQSKTTAQTTITDGFDIQNSGAVGLQMRASLIYTGSRTVLPATLRIYDIRMDEGSATANFTMTTGVYYAFTEVDSTRKGGREGPWGKVLFVGPAAADGGFTDKNRIDFTFPAAVNSEADFFYLYRTTDGGTSPNDLRLIAKVQVSVGTYRDDFSTYPKDTPGGALVPLLLLQTSEDPDAATPYPKNTPPPAMVRVRTFKGSLVGISANNPRTLYYSITGEPEHWPEIYVIGSFPMEEHDELIDLSEVGGSLVLGAKNVMMRVDSLPRIVAGVFDASDVQRINAAPGLVGKYAMTAFSVQGEPRVAWISYYGVWVTNGHTIAEITTDIDWTAFEGFDKSAWVLTWDPKYQTLVMDYSSTSSGTNNRYMLIHMAAEQQKPNGQPKITPGHYGAANCRALGQVGNYRRMYTGHTSDGSVYLEDDEGAGTDASNAYNTSGDWPMVVQTRRMYGDGDRYSILTAKAHHGDFTGNVTVTMTAGNDDTERTQTRVESVSMQGRKGTNYGVFQAGEWHEFKYEESGVKRGSLRETEMRLRRLGFGGKVRVA